MPLVVDSFVMGPFQSNCYVVRSERGAAEAAVIDPGADPTELRLELARLGARTGGILVTHTDVDHIGGVAALADGTGAEVWAPAGEAEALRTGETRGGMRVPPHEPGAHRHGRRRDHRRRHHVRGGRRSRPLGRPRRVLRGRRALLRRPAVRRLGRPRRPARRRLGDAARLGRARCSTASRRRRSSIPGTARRRRSAASSRRTRSSRELRAERQRRERRSSRRRAGRTTSCRPTQRGGTLVRTMEDVDRALRLAAHPDARLRGHRALRAHGRRGLRRRAQGDVHLHRPQRPLADASARGHGADLPRLHRARHAPRAAAGEGVHDRADVPLRRAGTRPLPRALAALASRRSARPTRRSTPRSSSSTTSCCAASASRSGSCS